MELQRLLAAMGTARPALVQEERLLGGAPHRPRVWHALRRGAAPAPRWVRNETRDAAFLFVPQDAAWRWVAGYLVGGALLLGGAVLLAARRSSAHSRRPGHLDAPAHATRATSGAASASGA